MIIANESPLRQLPSDLDRKQALFLDGMRYSVEMADLAYTRLRQTLFNLTKGETKFKTPADHLLFVSAVQDAWSLVDSLHRLRGLLTQMPGVKKKAPGPQIFMRQTSEVEKLRNAVQHLNSEIDGLVKRNQPVWGSLSWLTILEPNSNFGVLCSLLTGTFFAKARTANMKLPEEGAVLDLPVDLIELSAYGHTLDLSDAMKRVARLVTSMERKLNEQFKGRPVTGSDALSRLGVQFNAAEPETPDVS